MRMIIGNQGGGALMERGPLALFGAIVAVGIGPALWLGAQFGMALSPPSAPPAITSELDPGQSLDGGNGGGVGTVPDPASVNLPEPRQVQPRPAKPGSRTGRHAATTAPAKPTDTPRTTPPAQSDDDPQTTPTDTDTPSAPPETADPEPTATDDPPADDAAVSVSVRVV